MKRKVLILNAVLLLAVVSFSSCNKKATSSLKEKLESIQGISNVTDIQTQKSKEVFKDCYSFKVKQYVDWDNKSMPTFDQRVSIFYQSDNAITEYYINGYEINTGEPLNRTKNNDFYLHYADKYAYNIVQIEYRFFQESKPVGFNPKGTKYYQYLNSYQASKDFHNVINSLKTFLTGPTILDGGSKGGYTTEAMSYYYPDDINAYISYVAPLCNSDNDPRLSEYVYTTIGNKGFGEETATKYRTYVANFQRYALSNELRPLVKKHLKLDGPDPEGELLTNDEAYEGAVFNFGIGMWQYYKDFDKIDEINKLPQETDEQKHAKALAIAKRIDPNLKENDEEEDYGALPYFVQAKMEMGNYAIDFDYLRKNNMVINTKKERDALFSDYSSLTKEQIETFKYSPNFRMNLIDYFNSTTKDIVKIVGLNDPWYGVKAPTTENKYIHLFEVKNNHMSTIRELEEKEQKEVWKIVDSLLGV